MKYTDLTERQFVKLMAIKYIRTNSQQNKMWTHLFERYNI
jgi:hypothetical protein